MFRDNFRHGRRMECIQGGVARVLLSLYGHLATSGCHLYRKRNRPCFLFWSPLIYSKKSRSNTLYMMVFYKGDICSTTNMVMAIESIVSVYRGSAYIKERKRWKKTFPVLVIFCSNSHKRKGGTPKLNISV